MKERPIIFSGPMVRAILEGRKTQTRRIIKPQPVPVPPNGWERPTREKKHDAPYFDAYCNKRKSSANPRGMSQDWCWWDEWDRQCLDQIIKCPYGVPSDRLWVRETWNVIECHSSYEYGDCCFFAWDWFVSPWDMLCHECKALKGCNRPVLVYAADGEDKNPAEMYPSLDIRNGRTVKTKPELPWRPSIHMPRKASRIDLLIADIRVERLQDISIEDAINEGINCPVELDEPCRRCGACEGDDWDSPIRFQCNPRSAFFELWQSINGKRPGCAWDDNPYVWVVEFQCV